MWCRSYRDHVIMAFPSFDTATGLWAPQANISWVVGPARESEFVRFAKRVLTEAEAVALALNAARPWVDGRLRTPHSVARRETQYPARPVRTLTRSGGNVPLPRAAKSSDNTRILTFNQFKSLMGKTGLSASPQSLHKSYAALLQLRKQDNRSWAQIKFKIRGSQESAPAAQALAFKAKLARLPLTMRDWRRII
jgi:hypothetical protein